MLTGNVACAAVGAAVGTSVTRSTVGTAIVGTAVRATVIGATVTRTAVRATVGTTIVPAGRTLRAAVGYPFSAAVGATIMHTRHAVSTGVGGSFGLRHSAAPHRWGKQAPDRPAARNRAGCSALPPR